MGGSPGEKEGEGERGAGVGGTGSGRNGGNYATPCNIFQSKSAMRWERTKIGQYSQD